MNLNQLRNTVSKLEFLDKVECSSLPSPAQDRIIDIFIGAPELPVILTKHDLEQLSAISNVRFDEILRIAGIQ